MQLNCVEPDLLSYPANESWVLVLKDAHGFRPSPACFFGNGRGTIGNTPRARFGKDQSRMGSAAICYRCSIFGARQAAQGFDAGFSAAFVWAAAVCGLAVLIACWPSRAPAGRIR